MTHQLPIEYVQFRHRFRHRNRVRLGYSDFEIGGSIELEDLEGVDKFNADIQIKEYAPGFTAFAGNGGGEFYAFDSSGAVFVIPLIGMSASCAIKLADSWDRFSAHVTWEGRWIELAMLFNGSRP
jgi:hypothetical protein